MILFLAAQDISCLEVGLLDNQGRLLAFEKMAVAPEKYLATVSDFLSEQKAALEDLRKIVVVSGPGSFTACRFVVTIANSLAFAKNLPIVGVKNSERRGGKELIKKFGQDWFQVVPFSFVNPTYDRPPHITLKK